LVCASKIFFRATTSFCVRLSCALSIGSFGHETLRDFQRQLFLFKPREHNLALALVSIGEEMRSGNEIFFPLLLHTGVWLKSEPAPAPQTSLTDFFASCR
jgi:hypothetical protein